MTVPEKLDALRCCMRGEGIDAWLVPTDDFHGSEYVGDYFQCRAWLTGFTGSAGTALVTMDGAYLWTDGRYFLQAGQELAGSGIELMKIGEEGVPTIEEFLEKHLAAGNVLGYDGRCMTAAKGEKLRKALTKKGILCRNSARKADPASGDRNPDPADGPIDLVGRIWEDRPAMSCTKVFELDITYAGKSRADKLKELRGAMEKEDCDYHLIASLDDIAWLLNLRGNDVLYNPVFLSYLEVTKERAVLFANRQAFEESIVRALEKDGVELRPYGEVYDSAARIPEKSRVLLDPASVNDTLWTSLARAERISRANPSILMKAVKNPVEVQHMREAHVKDGVAVTRFIFWLKQQMKEYDPAHPVTELDVVDKLLALRSEQEHFLEPSFETIASYGPHGAIVHYSPTKESNLALKPESFLLLDSGGQYLEGTTDITRTIACGKLTQEEKEFYTRILKGHLNLGAVKFLHGCSGTSLDYLARQPLWEIGMDYNHGTGHGVGFLLNVHEGPNSFSYKTWPHRVNPCVMEEGMITTNEPGFYLEGKFGVRCENVMLCVKDEKNEYGQFLHFEHLTLVPWELDAVVPELLTDREKHLLNEYHALVWEKISPYLAGEEKEWLREATRPLPVI